MEHVRPFSGFPGLDDVLAFLATTNDGDDNQHPAFQQSELYSSKVDAKIIDESLRKSEFRTFEDDKLFGYVERVVSWLNGSDKHFHYQLRRDNITEMRYKADGKFLKHTDFLSVSGNLVEEFTMILCVTPKHLASSAEGGETLIYPYASEKGKAFDTATPGNGLLFRKDLEHAGGVLKAGEKHILTANIIATRKQTSDQVLFVTFPLTPGEEEDEGASNKKESQGDILQRIANQGTSYALPVDCLKGSMLEAHVRFFNQQCEHDEEEPPKIVSYHCTDFSYEEFGTVAKILLSSYIQEDDISKHARAIDYFGPFTNEKLLVNLAVEPGKGGEEESNAEEKKSDEEDSGTESPDKNCKRFVQPSTVSHSDGLFPAAKKTKSDSSSDGDDFGVIVCENESRTKVVYEVAQALGLSTYVPFKMVFVRGVMLHGHYDETMSVPLTAAGLVVGDYNHIFALQNIGGQRSDTDACTIADYHEKYNYFSEPNPPGWDAGNGTLFARSETEESDYDDLWQMDNDQLYGFQKKPRGLGLKLALGDEDARGLLSNYVLGNPGLCNYVYRGPQLHELKPLSDFLGDSPFGSTATTSLFHRDSSGMATFTSEEAQAASDYIASMDLDGRVMAAVQEKKFELPQQMDEKDEYYCNESTYSNLSLLYVTGLVRLDPSIDATSNAIALSPKEFNAWPTKEQRRAALNAARNNFARSGISGYVSHYFYEYDYFRASESEMSDESDDY